MRFQIKDSDSGETLTIEADHAPTQDDAQEIFSTRAKPTEETPQIPVSNVRVPHYAKPSELAQPLTSVLGKAAEISTTSPLPQGSIPKGVPQLRTNENGIFEPVKHETSKSDAFILGTSDAIKKTAEFFLTPAGIATVGLGTLPASAQRIAALTFATDMATKTPELARQLGEEIGKNESDRDYTKIGNLVSSIVINTGFAGLAGAHGLTPKAVPPSSGETLSKILSDQIKASGTTSAIQADRIITPEIQHGAVVSPELVSLAPLTAEALKATATTGEPNASSIGTPKEIHGSLQSQPIESTGEVPAAQGGAGILPQTEQRLRRAIGETSPEPLQTEARPASGEVIAGELGLTWKPNAGFGIEDLAEKGMSPEQIEMLSQIQKQQGWEFTDRRSGSDTEGLTVYLPEGSTKEQVLEKFTKAAEGYTPLEKQLSPLGMGAARAGELTPTPKTPTAIKNAQVDTERQQRGLPPAIEPAKRSFGAVWDEAMAKIDHDPAYPDTLIGELTEKPRALTDTEDAVLLHRQIDLQNEYGKATRDLAQAFEDGRLGDVELEKARVAALSDRLFDIYELGKKVGTETGRGLNARKMMAYEDFSLAKMELEARASKGGRPLTDEERSEVTTLNEKIEKTQKAFDEYVAKTDKDLAERDLRDALNEMQKDLPEGKRKVTPKQAATLQEKIANKTEVIKARIEKGERNEIGSLVQQLARLFVEQGIKERDPLIDAVHDVLKTIDPKFTRRETMDAISGYGDFRQLTKDEISLKVRDLKGQMQQVAKLEDMQANKPPLKTGQERRVPSTEESRLIRLVNEAKNQFQIPITDEATQLKSSLDMLKSRLKHKTAEWEDRLKRGDFEKKPKRIVQMDAEANRLHFENAKAKAKWHEALMKDRLAKQNPLQKTIRFGAEAINTARVIETSADMSAVLRQGGFIAFGHPIRALRSFPAMFRAFRSAENQHAITREIMARKNYPLYQQGKLYLAEHNQRLSQMEEAYMSRWAEKIPLVAGSQRAYTTFLNKLRADSFDAMADSLARDKELTPAEVKAIANFINVATGRGSFGMNDNALVGINTVFFAPRYVASRFQLVLGTPLYRGTARTRIAVAKEYGRYLAGLSVVYGLGLLAGGKIEPDSRSSDFGKMRWGNSRLDPLSGLSQATVLLSRLFTGETKNSKGKVVPIRGDKIPFGGANSYDVIAQFLRTKFSPGIGAIVNILSGKDVVGQPVTLASTAKNLLIPLSFNDVYQSIKEQGIPGGVALSILALFGMSVQNYQPK